MLVTTNNLKRKENIMLLQNLKFNNVQINLKISEINIFKEILIFNGVNLLELKSILDLGCGNGQEAMAIADVFQNSNITGIDKTVEESKKIYQRTNLINADLYPICQTQMS
jgi:tRNA1(Val) A37 N6-methylase TrmN6